jgi:hypothetical protein
VIGIQPLIDTQAASTRHPTPSSCRLTHDSDANRPLSRSSWNPALRTPSAPKATLRTAVCSRPCARVIGISVAISPTRAENCSTSRRKLAFRSALRRLRIARSSTASGIVSA